MSAPSASILVFSGSWHVTHGTRFRLGPGDLHFTDSRHPFDYDFLTNWKDVYVRLSEQFVRRWVRNPIVLGERPLGDSQWGRVLASYLAQLSPEFVVRAPLPQAVLIDQLGALLALTASERSGSRAVSTPAERSVRDHVYDHIRQRCADTSLQAADIASSLNISTRTLHRALGGLWRHVRSDADPSSRRSRCAHASIAAVRSRDHRGDRATRRILGRLPLREGPAQAHRPDAAADAPCEPRQTDRPVGDIR